MLAIKINNPEIESKVKEYAKEQKRAVEDLVSDALKMFIDLKKKDNKLVYIKKDPKNHLHQINHNFDNELCNETALNHIENSAQFVHDLRRKDYE